MPGSVAESTGGTQPNPCAIRKGGAQSSGALGYRNKEGGVTTAVVMDMENSLLTLCWEAGKTSTGFSLKGLAIRTVGSSHREDSRRRSRLKEPR